MKLRDIPDMLVTITPNVHHYFAAKQKGNYFVWAEDGQSDALHGNDRTLDQVVQGTIDYFTRDEYDPVLKEVQEKLNDLGVAWRWSSVQHEQETGYIHYEWIWEMILDG